jgi:hypothetical protein
VSLRLCLVEVEEGMYLDFVVCEKKNEALRILEVCYAMVVVWVMVLTRRSLFLLIS